MPPISDLDLAAVGAVIADSAGLSLASGGLEVALRVALDTAAAARAEPVDTLAARVLARDPAAVADLLEHAVVRETTFFRHPEQLAALVRRLADAPAPLAIWCAGCATGEEPWSVAMALALAGRADAGDRILATDVSARSLEAAARATYAPRAWKKLPPSADPFLDAPGPDGLRAVGAGLRDRVAFERHNLVRDPAPSGARFDAILCRNVLIYFEPVAASSALGRLAAALKPGGLLALGPVEQPLAMPLPLAWIEDGQATLLRRP